MRKYNYIDSYTNDSLIKNKIIKPANLFEALGSSILSGFKDSINLNDTISIINFLNSSIYYKAKYYHCLGLYYYYNQNNIYIAYDFLIKSYNLYINIDQYCFDLTYLCGDLINFSNANRENYLSEYFTYKIFEKYKKSNKFDTISNYLFITYQSLSKALNNKQNEIQNLFNNIDENKCKDFSIKLYQHVIFSKINLLRNINKNKSDSLLLILKKSKTYYVNYYKAQGESYIRNDAYLIGINYLNKAIKYFYNSKFILQGQLLTIYDWLSYSYTSMGRFEKSNEYHYKILIFPRENIKYDINNLLSLDKQYEYFDYTIYNSISGNYINIYHESNKINDLLLAKQFNDKALKYISREEYTFDEDRRTVMLNSISEVYSVALDINYYLFKITNDLNYYNFWMNISNKNKSIIFNETSSDKLFKYQIPPNIIETILSSIYSIKNYIYKNEFSDSIITQKTNLTFLSNFVKSKYKIKFDTELEFFDYCKKFEDTSICIINIDEVNKNLYLALKLNDTVILDAFKKDERLDNILDLISSYQRNESSDSNYINNCNVLWSYFSKYETAFQKNNVSKICLSLDSKFYNINFEALELSKNNFLIKKYQFILVADLNKLYNINFNNVSNIKIANFAFSNIESIKIGLTENEIPGSIIETNIINKYFKDAENFEGNKCTKDNFIIALSTAKYNYIHLSTHGNSNSQIKDNVYLIFKNKINQFDTLYGFELSKKIIVVNNLILTSCMTGSGNFINGDYLFNLPRYCLIGGVNKLIYPNWNVNDVSSTMIFSNFYRLLKSGNSMSDALWSSKILYINKKTKNHPYYWANFVFQI